MRQTPKCSKGFVLLHWLMSILPMLTLTALFLVSLRIATLPGEFPAYRGYEQVSKLTESLNDRLTTAFYQIAFALFNFLLLSIVNYRVSL